MLPDSKHYLSFLVIFIITSMKCFSGKCSCKQVWGPFDKTFKQRQFSNEDFHYLNVTRVGTFTSNDVFDCTFECLRNALCLSINVAASRGADGKLWCEMLSSDKYRDAENYAQNVVSHHFSITSPCSFLPCRNGGTCIPNHKGNSYDCLCGKPYVGEYCEKVKVKSCKEHYDVFTSNVSQLVTLHIGSGPTSVLCHMGDFGCGVGGWTPVMKIDGNKGTFHFNSHHWEDFGEYNLPGGETGFDELEAKLPTYWNTSFSKICLGMKIGQQLKFIVIDKTADSLYSLIADGQYRPTSLGRGTWKKLIGSQASLQLKCNNEGFNARCFRNQYSKARIGIIGSHFKQCSYCSSQIGFGTAGYPDLGNTCGNDASSRSDNGEKRIRAMGYILIQ